MPTLEWNVWNWDKNYDWSGAGEEWSVIWGNSARQWQYAILPRISSFLPAGRILEIAPGYGRWTNYLKSCCDELVSIDVSAKCIEHCQERFKGDEHIQFFVNDGTSLDAIEDSSVDFAFTFDSLVHAEIEIIREYLNQLSRKLTPNGVAFLHHSNLGNHNLYRSALMNTPRKVKEIFSKLHLDLPELHGRAGSVSQEAVNEICNNCGLKCIAQEVINWGTPPRFLIDCFTLVTPEGSRFVRENRIIRNPHFMLEAGMISNTLSNYGPQSFGSPANTAT